MSLIDLIIFMLKIWINLAKLEVYHQLDPKNQVHRVEDHRPTAARKKKSALCAKDNRAAQNLQRLINEGKLAPEILEFLLTLGMKTKNTTKKKTMMHLQTPYSIRIHFLFYRKNIKEIERDTNVDLMITDFTNLEGPKMLLKIIIIIIVGARILNFVDVFWLDTAILIDIYLSFYNLFTRL